MIANTLLLIWKDRQVGCKGVLATLSACYSKIFFFSPVDHINVGVQDRTWVAGGGVVLELQFKEKKLITHSFLSVSFGFIQTLYSCGNVIVLVIVHFINNWFMMILVAVYVCLKINAMKSPLLSVNHGRTQIFSQKFSFFHQTFWRANLQLFQKSWL